MVPIDIIQGIVSMGLEVRGKTPGVNVKVRKRGLLAMDLCSVDVEGTTIT